MALSHLGCAAEPSPQSLQSPPAPGAAPGAETLMVLGVRGAGVPQCPLFGVPRATMGCVPCSLAAQGVQGGEQWVLSSSMDCVYPVLWQLRGCSEDAQRILRGVQCVPRAVQLHGLVVPRILAAKGMLRGFSEDAQGSMGCVYPVLWQLRGCSEDAQGCAAPQAVCTPYFGSSGVQDGVQWVLPSSMAEFWSKAFCSRSSVRCRTGHLGTPELPTGTECRWLAEASPRPLWLRC